MRALLLALAAALPAFADIGPKPRSEAPGLEATGDMKGVDVEMASEEVTLVLGRADRDQWVDKLSVEATFEMINTGAAAKFEEGFPIGPVKNMKGFRAEIDGKAVEPRLVDRYEGRVKPVTEAEADKYDDSGRHDYWYVWDAEYPAGATRVHKVAYVLELFGYSEHRSASYVLSTGARWKNAIGRATVTFRCEKPLSLDHVRSARPLSGAATADAITWTFEKLEPTEDDDISVLYNFKDTWDEGLARLRADARVHWSAKKELAWTLGRAQERFARAELTKEERAAYLDAVRSILDEGAAKDGGFEFPADELQRLQVGDDIPPEVREEIEKNRTREARDYAFPGQSAQLFEFFDPLLEAAKKDPAAARPALERWAAVGEAFLAGKVTAGGKALAAGDGDRERMTQRVNDARALLK